MMETDPLNIPAPSFKMISRVFEITDRLAAVVFLDILLLLKV